VDRDVVSKDAVNMLERLLALDRNVLEHEKIAVKGYPFTAIFLFW